MSKLVMVEMLHAFRMRYVVRVEDDIDHALDAVIMNEGDPRFNEFSQRALAPTSIIDHYEITEEEYLKLFDQDNDYLGSWTDEQKKSFINEIEYETKEIDDGA